MDRFRRKWHLHLLPVLMRFASISRRQFSDKQLFKPAHREERACRQQLTGDHSGTTDQLETKEPDISPEESALIRTRSKQRARVNIELRSRMLMFVSAGVKLSSCRANLNPADFSEFSKSAISTVLLFSLIELCGAFAWSGTNRVTNTES